MVSHYPVMYLPTDGRKNSTFWPGHWLANWGFKIGFGVTPKLAKVMAELVLEGRDGVPEGFRVEGLL